jgi:hypothetical protein
MLGTVGIVGNLGSTPANFLEKSVKKGTESLPAI